MSGLEGVTAMEVRVAEVTVRVVFPETLPKVAVTMLAPAETAVTSPLLLMVATVVFEEFHVTCEVRSNVDESE